MAARDHMMDIGSQGFYGHSSSMGLSTLDRVRSYNTNVPGMLGENIAYSTSNPIEAIILMLIDDGDNRHRTMRSHVLDPTHRMIGMASGPHKF